MQRIVCNTCPICGALLQLDNSITPMTCDYCGAALLSSCGDPGMHSINEIDPDICGGFMGVFTVAIHPVGTKYCGYCGHVYPATFECCPMLVDLAFDWFDQPTDKWPPSTQERLRRFLIENRVVVENTAQLRLIQAKHDEISQDIAKRIVDCLETIGLARIVGSIENMI